MYGYSEYTDITVEQVLQKVTQQQIFELVLGSTFDFSGRYCSPLREDTKPDCRFEERPDGTILFVDFGERLLTGKTHRTCFSMIMDYYSISLNEAIKLICGRFNLSTNSVDYPKSIHKVSYDYTIEKQETIITYEAKYPSKSDVLYWSQFLISIDNLTEDNVFCVRSFNISNHKGKRKINAYKNVYAIDFIDAVKIYQPYNNKYKWITNCNENHIGNIDNLPSMAEELIIQKSYKDYRVLKNLDYSNIIWFHNEGCLPSMDILKNLTDRFKIITVFYDNDEDGVKAGEKLCTIFNSIRENCSRLVYLPRKRLHKKLYGNYLKDPAEFIHREGKQDLVAILKQIGIYGKDS